MTQDEIIEMATEAGLAYNHDDYPDIWDTYMNVGREEIMVFAKLVAQTEREACAKLLESRKTGANELMDAVRDMESKAIRARGEQA
jgi:hypothetical protein